MLDFDMTSFLKSLIECREGKEYTVLFVRAGFGAKKRLANLGIIPGEKIVKSRTAPFRGPVEVMVKGSKLVLGRGLAAKIIVKE